MGAATAARDLPWAVGRAEREFTRGRLKEGIGVLARAVALDPRNVSLRIMLAIAYARTRQVELAFQQLERAVQIEPGGFGPQCALAELYLRLGIPEQARWHLDAALARAATPAERAYVHGLERAGRTRKGSRAHLKQPFWLLNRDRPRTFLAGDGDRSPPGGPPTPRAARPAGGPASSRG
jgi:tetratricopeptide (TPR) repeat protein